MTWQESITDFAHYLKFERNLSQNTLLAYERDLKKLQAYAEHYLPDSTPETLSYPQLQECLYHFSKQDWSERSQARWVSSIKAYFKYLIEDEIREDNPSALLDSPKQGIYLPDSLSQEEIDQLLSAIDTSTSLGKRNYCIIEVLYGCGLRVSEMISLKISDINFKENFIKVNGKGNKVRLVPIADYTLQLIKDYINGIRASIKIAPHCSDYLFLSERTGKPLTRVMIFTFIKQYALLANIQKKISPHTFRHSFATHLLQNGADLRFIQEMLGHSSITTTEIYTHLQTEELHATILNFHPRSHS